MIKHISYLSFSSPYFGNYKRGTDQEKWRTSCYIVEDLALVLRGINLNINCHSSSQGLICYPDKYVPRMSSILQLLNTSNSAKMASINQHLTGMSQLLDQREKLKEVKWKATFVSGSPVSVLPPTTRGRACHTIIYSWLPGRKSPIICELISPCGSHQGEENLLCGTLQIRLLFVPQNHSHCHQTQSQPDQTAYLTGTNTDR